MNIKQAIERLAKEKGMTTFELECVLEWVSRNHPILHSILKEVIPAGDEDRFLEKARLSPPHNKGDSEDWIKSLQSLN